MTDTISLIPETFPLIIKINNTREIIFIQQKAGRSSWFYNVMMMSG